MGTTLTGTTPQDTYDSLIKVTDNGPLSGTAKYLSDGLGNDSALALSTARALVGKTTNNNTFNSRLQVLSDNTVAGGVLVDHFQNDATGAFLFLAKSRSNTVGTSTIVQNNDNLGAIDFYGANGSTWSHGASIGAQVDGTAGATNDMPSRLIFSTAADGSATPTERLRITSSGLVGIGTTTPSSFATLSINKNGASEYSGVMTTNANSTASLSVGVGGNSVGAPALRNNAYILNTAASDLIFGTTDTERMRILAGGGLTFNGDTAAANALSDYETGTWTMGIAFGGASVGVTYSNNTGTYTKIGRKVTVNGYMSLTNRGSSTGTAAITGLPFTVASGNTYYSAASLAFFNISFANQYQAYGQVFSNNIFLEEITEAGVGSSLTDSDFANNSALMVSLTYFV